MRVPLENEQLGAFWRKCEGIKNKIEEGGLDYQRALSGLQAVFDGRDFLLSTPAVQPPPEIVVPAPAIIVPPAPTLFKTAETDLNIWLGRAEKFAKKFLGVEANLREMFAIPEELPWQSAIPVFDPGGLNNRQAVEKALQAQGLAVWEEADVMKYSGSEAIKKPTLHLINNSIRPDEETMGLSPDQLVAMGKSWLSQRAYVLAFGLHHSVTDQYLDPETWTWFPDNRLSSGSVADGGWGPSDRRVGLSWCYPDFRYGFMGSRLAISVPLKS